MGIFQVSVDLRVVRKSQGGNSCGTGIYQNVQSHSQNKGHLAEQGNDLARHKSAKEGTFFVYPLFNKLFYGKTYLVVEAFLNRNEHGEKSCSFAYSRNRIRHTSDKFASVRKLLCGF